MTNINIIPVQGRERIFFANIGEKADQKGRVGISILDAKSLKGRFAPRNKHVEINFQGRNVVVSLNSLKEFCSRMGINEVPTTRNGIEQLLSKLNTQNSQNLVKEMEALQADILKQQVDVTKQRHANMLVEMNKFVEGLSFGTDYFQKEFQNLDDQRAIKDAETVQETLTPKVGQGYIKLKMDREFLSNLPSADRLQGRRNGCKSLDRAIQVKMLSNSINALNINALNADSVELKKELYEVSKRKSKNFTKKETQEQFNALEARLARPIQEMREKTERLKWHSNEAEKFTKELDKISPKKLDSRRIATLDQMLEGRHGDNYLRFQDAQDIAFSRKEKNTPEMGFLGMDVFDLLNEIPADIPSKKILLKTPSKLYPRRIATLDQMLERRFREDYSQFQEVQAVALNRKQKVTPEMDLVESLDKMFPPKLDSKRIATLDQMLGNKHRKKSQQFSIAQELTLSRKHKVTPEMDLVLPLDEMFGSPTKFATNSTEHARQIHEEYKNSRIDAMNKELLLIQAKAALKNHFEEMDEATLANMSNRDLFALINQLEKKPVVVNQAVVAQPKSNLLRNTFITMFIGTAILGAIAAINIQASNEEKGVTAEDVKNNFFNNLAISQQFVVSTAGNMLEKTTNFFMSEPQCGIDEAPSTNSSILRSNLEDAPVMHRIQKSVTHGYAVAKDGAVNYFQKLFAPVVGQPKCGIDEAPVSNSTIQMLGKCVIRTANLVTDLVCNKFEDPNGSCGLEDPKGVCKMIGKNFAEAVFAKHSNA